jgi:alpha-1,6-mannosyltransferase
LASELRASAFDRAGQLPTPLRPGADLAVLDVTKYFGDRTGGIRTYLLEKARYVAAHPKVRQTMVVPGPDDRLAEINGVRCYRLRNRIIPAQDQYRFLLNAGVLDRILERERPDLIEVGSTLLVPWVVRRANRRHQIPMVWFFHSNLPRLVAETGPRIPGVRNAMLRGARAYMARLGSLFCAAIAASETAARDLESYGVGPVLRVPLGVDLEMFTPERKQWARETREQAGLPEGPLALYAGRLAGEKRLDVLLDGWAHVERRTGARLVVQGDGPARERLERHPYAPHVIWRPLERDRQLVADLLAATDLFVAPGPVETFGLAALEALASGVPVLSADTGAVAELIEASGAGTTFVMGESADLADQAVQLLEQDLALLGGRGREYAERHHSWTGVFDRLFLAYRSIVDIP